MGNFRSRFGPLFIAVICLFFVFTSFFEANAGLGFVKSNYAAGNSPSCVTTGDVNGDNSLDLVVANYASNTLTVFTNDGSGILNSNSSYAVGDRPVFVVAGDFRSNGSLDLVCANFGGGGGKTLTVLTNNGNGSFGSNTTLAVGLGPISLAVGDYNNDGKLDLVCANAGTNGNGNTLTLFTNNGAGLLVSNVALNVGGDPRSVVLADFNGDGRLDLASANYLSNSISVFTNRGSGRFGSNDTLTVSLPTFLLSSDVNADGKPDLVYGSSYNQVAVLINNGTGRFTSTSTLSLGSIAMGGPIFPYSITSADMNGDGKMDIMVGCETNVGFGVGAVVVFTNRTSSYQLSPSSTNNVGTSLAFLTATDINADGKPDLICANSMANTFTILVNTNAFPQPTSIPSLTVLANANRLVTVSWPSSSPGWSLQEISDPTKTTWLPSGYSGFTSVDDGTNKSLTQPILSGVRLFRLHHP